MGGEVGVESQVGRGSDFWWKLSLPLDPAHTGPARAESLAGLSALIVDDAEVTRTVLAEKLARQGMTAGTATRGLEALALLREAAAAGRPYDVTLVDLLMPEMDGEQFGEAVRREASIAATKLVILTGQPGPGDGVRFEAAGFDGYLVKPVRDAVLIRALASVLGTSRERRKGIVTRHSIDEGGAIPTAAAVEQATFGGLRVLIAEDNSTNQRIIVRMLTKLDCRVGIAANGLEAVTMAKDFPFDVILMDMQMPEMDGLEASARIRELGGPHAGLPIIALTANAMESDREACMRAGMDDFLAKPVKRDELVGTLRRWERERARKAA
jgi:CheY-like chemotaxis protein